MTASPDADFRRAFALHQQGRLREAFQAYEAILAHAPTHALALHYSGLVLHQSGQPGAAITRIERALSIAPEATDAWSNLALAYQAVGRAQDALSALDQATRRAPGDAALWENYAAALLEAGRAADAERAARRALARNGRAAGASYNLALALREQGRLREAHAALMRSLAAAPAAPALLALKAELEAAQGDTDSARTTLETALERAPQATPLRFQLGSVCERAGDLGAAARAYASVVAAGDPQGAALSQLLFLRKRLADWHDLEPLRKEFHQGVAAKRPLLSPFCLLSDPSSRALQRHCAETWARTLEVETSATQPGEGVGIRPPARAGDRLTIGYLSADFHMHATALLTAGLFERHDRQRYRVVGYSTGPDDQSPLRKRVAGAFDRFVDARGWSAQRLAAQIRCDGVDVLVDLKGHTEHAPMATLALRPAPVQATYLGYPGTTGAAFIDYLIGDAIVTPLEHAGDYSETLVLLPGSYQVNDTDRPLRAAPPRTALGLPDEAIVLCCFNSTYKIDRDVFDAWMAILRDEPGAVLWLLARGDDDPAIANLRREAGARGVARERLVFATTRPNADYLGLYRHASLFLDTWPYNGHTTASDALWAGCPVVTTLGETFAGRVAASLLTSVGLPELIAADRTRYIALVEALVRDPERCAALRRSLETSGRQAPLFDTERTTRALERAFDAMAAQQRTGRREPIILAEDPEPTRA